MLAAVLKHPNQLVDLFAAQTLLDEVRAIGRRHISGTHLFGLRVEPAAELEVGILRRGLGSHGPGHDEQTGDAQQCRRCLQRESPSFAEVAASRLGQFTNSTCLVPETGLEPVLPCGKGILSTKRKGGGSTFI